MFESKEKKQAKKDAKLQELMESLGVGDLSGEDREIIESLLSNGCFVNNAKVLSVLSGGTTQAIANSLLVNILKTICHLSKMIGYYHMVLLTCQI